MVKISFKVLIFAACMLFLALLYLENPYNFLLQRCCH